jgi:HEPN domain-containing protein
LSPEHREYAELLAGKARDELRAAEALVATEGQASHVVGFLLQQAVEKSLKSLLAAREVEIPHAHNLGDLLALVQAQQVELPAAVASANWMTPWGVTFRYDDQGEDLDVEAALEAATTAIGLAEHVLAEDNTDPAA